MAPMATTQASSARVSPAREDPVVGGASQLIGGPPGAHAAGPGRRAWLTPLRILMALVILTSLLGYAQKASCRDTRNWTHEYQYSALCYSDVVALYSQEGLVDGKIPYLDYPTEYPPLIGAAMALIAWPARLAAGPKPVYRVDNGQQVVDHYTMDRRSAVFYDLTALLFLVAACVAVLCTALTAGSRRVWDAALFAVAPALVLHLLTNWDILAVAFAAGGLLAWSRRAPRLAGVLLGLGVLTKLYPALFLLGLLFLCLRAGKVRTWLTTFVSALVTVIVVMVPLWLVAGYFDQQADRVGDGILATFWHGGSWTHLLGGGPDGARNALARFFDLNSERGADWDSVAFGATWLADRHDPSWFGPMHLVICLVTAIVLIAVASALVVYRSDTLRLVIASAVAAFGTVAVAVPFVLQGIRDNGLPVHTLNIVTAATLVVSVIGIGLLTWLAPRRPRLPQVLFLLVVAFLLSNKVFSPQYTLWLLPLVALARPRWRLFLVWQICEFWVMFTRFMHFIYNDTQGRHGVDRGWFVGAVALRDFVLLVMAGFVVREILHPRADVIRAGTGRGLAERSVADRPDAGLDPDSLDDPAGGVLDHAPDVRGGWRGRPTHPDATTSASESAPTPASESAPAPASESAPTPASAVVTMDRTAAATTTSVSDRRRPAEETQRPVLRPVEPGALFRPRRRADSHSTGQDTTGHDLTGQDTTGHDLTGHAADDGDTRGGGPAGG
ncbi:glycosyltransferase 87 family protein [Frankia sp. R82]|uniref:glycosyltransferase 87 family protein n=1 Tax=Frankia sp. R82 TaxID=2950553 RepID=UPI002042E81E|nr:glycosyltransferase 87 family protein [Frankia sp. R82]MCM3886006.1 glycosyltransferase 87 family protein [Frankia sp. R82]